MPPDKGRARYVEKVSLQGWSMSGGWKRAGSALPAYIRADYAMESSGTGTARVLSPPLRLCRGDVLAGYALPGPEWKAIQVGVDTNGDGLMDENFGALGEGWQRWAFEAGKDMSVRLLVADFEVSPRRWVLLAQPAVYSAGPCAGRSAVPLGDPRLSGPKQ